MEDPRTVERTAGRVRATAAEGAPGGGHAAPNGNAQPWVDASAARLLQGALFGLAFGFLLQKGGVAKFDILIGVLLLENPVVVQVMLSAIVVGMVGVHLLERAGVLELQLDDTVYGSNIIGGLIFGLGFGLIAYCPGTDAAAVGQGNLDALTGVAGMLCGSYLFALWSNDARRVTKWGQRGKITLADTLGVSRGTVVAVAAPVLIAVLVLLHVLADP